MKEAIGKTLRAARERSGLSQEALAFEIGVSQSVVSRIERGVVQPREPIRRIKEVLRLPPD